MWRGLPACCWRAEVGRVRSPHGRQPGVTAGWPRPLWEAPAGSRARGLVAGWPHSLLPRWREARWPSSRQRTGRRPTTGGGARLGEASTTLLLLLA